MEPSLTLPEGWQFASALDVASREGAVVRFKPTTLETLVDSPLFAGRYSKRIEIGSSVPSVPKQPPLAFTVFADSADEIDIKPEQLEPHRRLVDEAGALFRSWHFDHYDLMLTISENFGTIGLEHHRSSENGVRKGYFKDWDKTATRRDLLAHEFTHSWNGKFRRPADLWTPQLQRADARQPAVGVRGHDAILGPGARRPLGAVERAARARFDGLARRRPAGAPRGPQVARPSGHHAVAHYRRTRFVALDLMAASRGLLQRRAPRLAGCRHQAARADE